MTVHVVFRVARQIEGEYIAIQTLKAFEDKEKAQKYFDELPRQRDVKIDGPEGKMNCYCELAIHPVELE